MRKDQTNPAPNLAEIIRKRVADAYDRQEHRLIYDEMCYLHGVDSGIAHEDGKGSGRFHLYPSVRAVTKEIGRTQKTLKAAAAAQSRLMSATVMPEIAGVDSVRRELIRQYWLTRYQGTKSKHGSIQGPSRKAWLEGWLHGKGAVELGVVDGKDGRQRLHGRHCPATQIITDPYESDPRESRWVCFVYAIDPYEAEAKWGTEVVRRNLRTIEVGHGLESRRHQYVLVANYWDLGIGDDAPTRATFVGDIHVKPMETGRNVFEIIPAAWMVGLLLPNMLGPIGQVAMQRSAEMMINQILTAMRKRLSQPSFTYVAPDAFTPEAWEDMRQGRTERVLELENVIAQGTAVAGTTQAAQIDPMFLPMLQFAEQEFAEQSGMNEIDRGAGGRVERTKYEVALMQSATEANRSGAVFSTIGYLRDLMDVSFRIAKGYDREEWVATYQGKPLLVNNPTAPTTAMSQVLKDLPQIVVDQAALTAPDNQLKRAQELAHLKELAPFVGQTVNPETFMRRMFEVLGIGEAEAWLMKPQPAQQNELPGTPGDNAQAGEMSPEMLAAAAAGEI